MLIDVTFVLNDFLFTGFALIEGKSFELLPPRYHRRGLSDAYDN